MKTEKIYDWSNVASSIIIPVRKFNLIWVILGQEDEHFKNFRIEYRSTELIEEHIKDKPSLKKSIDYYFAKTLVSDAEYAWITESSRQNKFIEHCIVNNWIKIEFKCFEAERPVFGGQVLPKPVNQERLPLELAGKDRSIAIIDFWLACSLCDFNGRLGLIRQIRTMWENHIQLDKKFDWFNKDEPEARRREFWEWLRKKEPQHTFNLPSFQNHDELLSFFDQFNLNHLYQSDLMRRFKNTWNQQQLRARTKGKKQCNFFLSVKTAAKLKNLAEKYDMDRNQIIELLINDEAEKETYIHERLSRRQLLQGSPEPTA